MRLGRVLLDRGVLVATLALVAYVALAPAWVVDGDNAELTTLGTLGGAAHPPGYPAYLLWLRAWSWLPVSTPAQAAAIATGVLGALGVLALHAACRAWGARPLAATAAAAIYAAGPTIVRYATEAEVFAMNQLVVAAILWLAAIGGPLRAGWRVAALAAVAGIGLSDQLTCVLVAPVGVLGVVRGFRETARPRWVVAAAGVGALVAGLSPYAYLCATAPNPLSWGDIDSPLALARHFLRTDYGGPGAFSPRGEAVPILDNLWAWLATVSRGWLYLPLALGVGWLVRACVRPPLVAPTGTAAAPNESRAAWRLLAVSFAIAGPLLVVRFNVPLDALGIYVVERFHLMSLVVIAPAVACGLDAVIRRLPRERVGWVVVHVGFVAALAPALPHLAAVHTRAYETGVANLLASLPADAVVVQNREIYFVAGYLQLLRGARTDTVVVNWPTVRLPWYRDRLAAHGIDVEAGSDASTAMVSGLLAHGRAVFADDLAANVLAELPSYPYGAVFRVLPAGTPRPPIADVFAINRRVFADFDLDYPRPGPDDDFATTTHDNYARTWKIIGRALAAAGRRDEAVTSFAFARELGPQL